MISRRFPLHGQVAFCVPASALRPRRGCAAIIAGLFIPSLTHAAEETMAKVGGAGPLLLGFVLATALAIAFFRARRQTRALGLRLEEERRQWEETARLLEEKQATIAHLLRVTREGEPLLRMAGRLGRLGGWTLELPERRMVWSEQVRALHGWSEAREPTETQAIEAFTPEWREAARRAFTLCLERGQPFDFEAQILVSGGARLWVRVIGEPERDADGMVRKVNGAMQDIDERKAMEQQFLRAQRQESIGQLAGGIAHDLNNVLTPILMSIDLMRLRAREPEELHILNTINVSARRGAEMVRQVLSFARGKPGTRVATPVAQVFREIEVLLQDTLPRSVTWELRIAEDVHAIWCDPTQIHQVLLNLCVNARDAMPHGGLLTLAARNADPNEGDPRTLGAGTAGRHVVIEIVDTGVGIPPELREKIFDPFFTTKEVGKGTGLGLPTAAGIVRAHGGILQVESEVGHGATFRIYLPAAEDGPAIALSDSRASAPRGHGETILVIDDEEGVRVIMRQALEDFGYRVMEAENGADGVALYVQRREEIDLVLTDIMMPIMDGLTAIRALLNLDSNLRIIGASGLNAGVNRDDALAAGAKEFLAKPFTAEALLSTVRRVLDASTSG